MCASLADGTRAAGTLPLSLALELDRLLGPRELGLIADGRGGGREEEEAQEERPRRLCWWWREEEEEEGARGEAELQRVRLNTVFGPETCG